MTSYTEQEAREKWCPFARVGNAAFGAATNRRPDQGSYGMAEEFCQCIASDCMAWRWIEMEERTDDGWQPCEPSHGHCGLAGKP